MNTINIEDVSGLCDFLLLDLTTDATIITGAEGLNQFYKAQKKNPQSIWIKDPVLDDVFLSKVGRRTIVFLVDPTKDCRRRNQFIHPEGGVKNSYNYKIYAEEG